MRPCAIGSTLQVRYQRKRADGRYADVVNPDGRLVMLEVPIAVQK
jgi:hypothetical protein